MSYLEEERADNERMTRRCDLGLLPHRIIYSDAIMYAPSLDIVFEGHGFMMEYEGDGNEMDVGLMDFQHRLMLLRNGGAGIEQSSFLQHNAHWCGYARSSIGIPVPGWVAYPEEYEGTVGDDSHTYEGGAGINS